MENLALSVLRVLYREVAKQLILRGISVASHLKIGVAFEGTSKVDQMKNQFGDVYEKVFRPNDMHASCYITKVCHSILYGTCTPRIFSTQRNWQLKKVSPDYCKSS